MENWTDIESAAQAQPAATPADLWAGMFRAATTDFHDLLEASPSAARSEGLGDGTARMLLTGYVGLSPDQQAEAWGIVAQYIVGELHDLLDVDPEFDEPGNELCGLCMSERDMDYIDREVSERPDRPPSENSMNAYMHAIFRTLCVQRNGPVETDDTPMWEGAPLPAGAL